MDSMERDAESKTLNTLPKEKSHITSTPNFDSPIIESILLLFEDST
jgi:hypothetical protein